MPRPEIAKIDKDVLKDLLKEVVEDESELTRLVSLSDHPRIARYLGRDPSREDFDRKRLVGILRRLWAEQEMLKEEGRSLEDIIAAKIKNMYYPADKFPPRRSTPEKS